MLDLLMIKDALLYVMLVGKEDVCYHEYKQTVLLIVLLLLDYIFEYEKSYYINSQVP